MSLLEAREIRKGFPGVQALRGVDLKVESGSVEGLVGRNGAGKSTLISVISGLIRPDGGTLLIDGGPTEFHSVRAAQDSGIVTVPQDYAIFPQRSVIDNVLMPGRYVRRAATLINWRRTEAAALKALQRVSLAADPQAPVESLDLDGRRLVMIARALIREPRLLVLDEPTEAFTGVEVSRFFKVLRELVAGGVSVLYVSHRLDEVTEMADHVTVIRNGATVMELERGEVTNELLVTGILGSEVAAEEQEERVEHRNGDAPGEERVAPGKAAAPTREDLVVASDVRAGSLHGLDMKITAGEVVGICGLAGAGQEQVLELLFGELAIESGHLELLGTTKAEGRTGRVPGVVLIPSDRSRTGLMMGLSIRENLAIAQEGDCTVGRGIPVVLKRRERKMAHDLMDQVGADQVDLARAVSTLSGGNQQKVLFARGLASKAQLWLLSEPTAGLDVGAREQALDFLRRTVAGSERGRPSAAVLASTDFDDLSRACDRVYVMRNHTIVGELSGSQLTSKSLLASASYDKES